jgi:hypothetical protein
LELSPDCVKQRLHRARQQVHSLLLKRPHCLARAAP